MFERIKEDLNAALQMDPAVKSKLELLLCYPGIHALWLHRIASFLWKRKLFLMGRFISHMSRFLTGVEIHPGATIGRGVFIDHGMGIVIGETAIVGDGCLIYKGVVLGGTSLEKKKRHPELGKKVVVGSNACILGNIHIGDNVRIGSGSVVIKDVPSNATVVGVPGRVIEREKEKARNITLDHGKLPDPIAEVFKALINENNKLKERVRKMENILKITSNEDESATDNVPKIMTAFMKNYHDGEGI